MLPTATYINNRSNGIPFEKLASTVYDVGFFVIFNGLGQVIPATPGVPLVGLDVEPINSSDADFAVTRLTTITTPLPNDFLDVFATIGTALPSMVGKTFNIDPANPGNIDLSAYETLSYNTLAVSTFGVGHVITGSTSGATGIITVVNNSVSLPQLVFTVTSGTFLAGETITDGTSGATAKIVVLYPNGTQLEVVKYISADEVYCKIVSQIGQ